MLSAARLCLLAPESSFMGLSKRELSLRPNFLDFEVIHFDSMLTVSPFSSSRTLSVSEGPFFFRLPMRSLPRLLSDDMEPLLDKSPSNWNSVIRLRVEFSLRNFLILSFIVTGSHVTLILTPRVFWLLSAWSCVITSKLVLCKVSGCPGCFVFSSRSHCSSCAPAQTDITAAHFTHEEKINSAPTPTLNISLSGLPCDTRIQINDMLQIVQWGCLLWNTYF